MRRQIRLQHDVRVTALLRLSEVEIRALDALAGYGTDAFLDVFYEKLGRHYMQPHEEGIRTLFENIKKIAGPAIRDADACRELLVERHTPTPAEATDE